MSLGTLDSSLQRENFECALYGRGNEIDIGYARTYPFSARLLDIDLTSETLRDGDP